MIDVLIVEDDPMVAELNRGYLQRLEGFHVSGVVGTAQKALDFLSRQSVSLLLLDVFMPGRDGLALLQEVRLLHPQVDVIMVTAARNSQDIQKALRLGVIDYLVKPFVFERFQASLMAYQSRRILLLQEGELNQEDLDKRIFTHSSGSGGEWSPLPKGVDNTTLGMVRNVLAGLEEEFSLKDLEPLTGLSRISLKKYLNHMQEQGEVETRLVYSRMGRPVTLYSCCIKSTPS